MGRSKVLFLSAVLSLTSLVFAEGVRVSKPEDMYVKKSFLILKSTQDYDEAENFARLASKKLNVKLDLRGLIADKELGLTYPKKECEDNGEEYPCYYARGRFDDAVFISIEDSSYYDGFTKDYYIVVGAGGNAESKEMLPVAKQQFPDAYVKSTKVYIGCMH